MKTTLTVFTAVAALGMSVSAHSAQADDKAAKPERECMFTVQPRSWRVLDQQQLVLWGPSQQDAYLVTLFTPVSDLRFTESLAFIDDDHNGMICGDGGDKIAVPNSRTGTWPTIIKSMTKLDEAALIELGQKHNMKLLSAKRQKELDAAAAKDK